jgi:hypothetical protein
VRHAGSTIMTTALKVRQGPAGRARRACKGPARPPLAGREKRFRRDPKPALRRPTGRPYRRAYLDRCFGASKAASRAMGARFRTSVFEYGPHGATRPGRKGPHKEGVAIGVAPGSHYGVDLGEQGIVCGQRPGLRFEGLLYGQSYRYNRRVVRPLRTDALAACSVRIVHQ